MRTIYYGKNYRVFLENDIGRTEVATDLFDGMPDEIVDCYYYIPAGVTWRDSDGDEHTGECIVPSKDLAQFASMAKTVYAELDKPRTHFKIATVIVSAADILIDNKVPFASGTIGAILEVKFDDHWNGLDIHAVFEAGSVKRDVLVNGESVVIPSDILLKPGTYLKFGFCGYSKDTAEFVIRTSIYSLGFIPQGASLDGEIPGDPGFSTIQDLVIKVGDLEKLETTDKSSLVAAINEIHRAGPGDGSGGGNAQPLIDAHNVAPDSHNDIREAVQGLANKVNSFLDSDDQTLDQLTEIVAYIKSNKTLIDAVTTSKVNVSDIVSNLTTNVANKPLSAAMGVELKRLVNAIVVPAVPSWSLQPNKPTYTAEEVGALPKPEVDGVKGQIATSDGAGGIEWITAKAWDGKGSY